MPLEFTDLATLSPVEASAQHRLNSQKPLAPSACDTKDTLAAPRRFHLRAGGVFDALYRCSNGVLNASHFWGVNFIQS